MHGVLLSQIVLLRSERFNTRRLVEKVQSMDVEASPEPAAGADTSEHSPLLHTKIGSKSTARTAVIHLTASPATHGAAQRAPQQPPRDNLKSVVTVMIWYGSNIGCGTPAPGLFLRLGLQ